ncbi:ABC transporter ATP-binding protein [Desulfatirhabdium butyrativorans]|uniref:ABC transporter ATP-binding protein n=1 Tax=Desulfatirhabdium butyrativorans TaxID=340467 RepID=UPI00040F4FA0|nr:ABC transporter ATP-binding protein [Desulfatirhabdium butyrativorans]
MLEVKDLHSGYGKINVLRDVSFGVDAGEMVAIIGANGAGKTTLLKTISGVIRPSQGEIRFEGKPITRLPPEKIVRAGIAHVPEGRRVFAKATVQTNLEMGAFLRKDKAGIKRDIEKYYELFPILGERSNQLAGTLSGGEQQMLAIARGLMAQPRLLLLDEPSMGLAPFLVNEIMRVISRLHQEGIAILLIEQNVKKALTITQRACVMELGRIVLEGQSCELMHSDQVRKCYLGEH